MIFNPGLIVKCYLSKISEVLIYKQIDSGIKHLFLVPQGVCISFQIIQFWELKKNPGTFL